MAKLKVAELFYSIQGEGRYMGVPSVFLRTFGCNFKCEGFGMPKGEKTSEYIKINAENYSSYNDLPLVSTGCDSYASWDPRFKHLSPVLDTDSVAEAVVETLPFKEWREEHLVITGGEPLLGWQRAYPDLLEHPKMKALKEFTPLKTDTTETEQFNSILNEIEVLKKLSTRSDYVIKYLDSFSTDVLSRFKVYYIVTNLYEVNYSFSIS